VSRLKIVELLLISLIAVMSFLHFYKIILSPDILVHGDYRYALTVDQHIQYHLNNIFMHASKLPVLIILYPLKFLFGDVLAEKFFTVHILFLSALLIYFSNKYFIQRSISTSNEIWICLSAFMGTLIFLYNPWTINKTHHHYWLVLSLAASYALIFRIDKMVRDKVKSYLIESLIIAFLLFLSVTQVQAPILYLGFFLITYIMFFYRGWESVFKEVIKSENIFSCYSGFSSQHILDLAFDCSFDFWGNNTWLWYCNREY